MLWVHRIPTQSIAITWVTRFTWALHPSPDVVTDGLDPWKFAFRRNYWPFSESLPIHKEMIIAQWFNEWVSEWVSEGVNQSDVFAIDVVFSSLLRWGLSPPYHWDATCQMWAPDSTASQLTRRYQCTVLNHSSLHMMAFQFLHSTILFFLHAPGTLRFHILLLLAAFVASYCNSQPAINLVDLSTGCWAGV